MTATDTWRTPVLVTSPLFADRSELHATLAKSLGLEGFAYVVSTREIGADEYYVVERDDLPKEYQR